MSKTTYNKDEVEQLLADAARMPEAPQRDPGYDKDDLKHAAEDAGISEAQLARAVHKRESRRTLVIVIGMTVALAVTATVAAIFFSDALFGDHDRRVIVDNESELSHTVQVLVPRVDIDPIDCAKRPSVRVSAQDYCIVHHIQLASGAKTRLDLPKPSSRCAQVWVRVVDEPYRASSAVFTLPAGVEIERGGNLDQKGLGSPHMYPSPSHANDIDLPVCRGAYGDIQ